MAFYKRLGKWLIVYLISTCHFWECNAKITKIQLFPETSNRCSTHPNLYSVDGAYLTAEANVTTACEITLMTLSSRADGFIVNIDKSLAPGEELTITNAANGDKEVLDWRSPVCCVTDNVVHLAYKRDPSSSIPQFAVILTQYLCYHESGLWNTLCRLRTCQQITNKPCSGAIVSEDMKCDGYNSCPLREDENTCVIRTISTLAFVGTIVFLLAVLIVGALVVIYRKIMKRRRRQRVSTAISYNMAVDDRGGRALTSVPPSYHEVHVPPAQAAQQGSVFTDVVYMDELPKYEVVLSQLQSPNSGPAETHSQPPDDNHNMS